MRSLDKVIDQMIPLIPVEEDDLIKELLSVKQSAVIAAPEAVYIHWQRVADAFSGRFGTPPTSGWGLEIINIWMEKE